MTISGKVLSAFAKAVPWAKAIKKAAAVSTGQRVFPSRTPKNDAKENFRLDKGVEIDGKHELILQANKNAEDSSVKEAAAKDSHAILAKILVDPVNDKDGSTASEDLIAAFKATRNEDVNCKHAKVSSILGESCLGCHVQINRSMHLDRFSKRRLYRVHRDESRGSRCSSPHHMQHMNGMLKEEVSKSDWFKEFTPGLIKHSSA